MHLSGSCEVQNTEWVALIELDNWTQVYYFSVSVSWVGPIFGVVQRKMTVSLHQVLMTVFLKWWLYSAPYRWQHHALSNCSTTALPSARLFRSQSLVSVQNLSGSWFSIIISCISITYLVLINTHFSSENKSPNK